MLSSRSRNCVLKISHRLVTEQLVSNDRSAHMGSWVIERTNNAVLMAFSQQLTTWRRGADVKHTTVKSHSISLWSDIMGGSVMTRIVCILRLVPAHFCPFLYRAYLCFFLNKCWINETKKQIHTRQPHYHSSTSQSPSPPSPTHYHLSLEL